MPNTSPTFCLLVWSGPVRQKTSKEIVLETLHDLEADGMAKPVRAESPQGYRTVVWVIHDELGGVAYFEQGQTHLTRLTESEFHRYRPI